MSNDAQPVLNIDDRSLTILDPRMIHRYHEAIIFIGPNTYDWQHAQATYASAVAQGAPLNHPALEYWSRKSNEQTLRTAAYTALVNEFNRLEAAGPATDAEKEALREQFEVAVLMLECWVVKCEELFSWVQRI